MSSELLVAVLSLGVGSAVGWWAALWWRDRVPFGHKQLLRRVFIHVDQLIGATETENQVRAGKRFAAMRPVWRGGLGKNLGKAWADAWWPVRQYGGTSARPTTKRMGAYVQLQFRWVRPWWGIWWRPYRIWDIDAVILHWTSEANALGEGYERNVGRKVAQALRLSGVDQLDIHVDTDRGLIRYSRKQAPREMPTTMPHEVTVDA